jgi:methylenetetrahydrofolate reductase (NADPH)
MTSATPSPDATAPDAASPGGDDDVTEAAGRLARRPWPATPLGELEVSFEFFPAATPVGLDRLLETADHLAPLDPRFVSVTYGAGGTNQDRTLLALERLGQMSELSLAGHLTTVGSSRGQTLEVVDTYIELGVRHIVALRGDPPADGIDGADDSGRMPDGFGSAAELVAGIRDRVGDRVEISVAAYPEVHPKAPSAEADLDNLKRKVDAGADRAITQFFYDNDTFLRFQDRCHSAGISVPIVAGIMPIASFPRVASFAERCGAAIPRWMPDLFGGLDDAPEVHQLVAATVAAEQCRGLAERGVRHFHFYTMNRPELTAATCRILGIRPRSDDAASSQRRGA